MDPGEICERRNLFTDVFVGARHRDRLVQKLRRFRVLAEIDRADSTHVYGVFGAHRQTTFAEELRGLGKAALGSVVERTLGGALRTRVHGDRDLELRSRAQHCGPFDANLVIDVFERFRGGFRGANRGQAVFDQQILQVAERVLRLGLRHVVARQLEVCNRFVEQGGRFRQGLAGAGRALRSCQTESHESQFAFIGCRSISTPPAGRAQRRVSALGAMVEATQLHTQVTGALQTSYLNMKTMARHCVLDFRMLTTVANDDHAQVDVLLARVDEIGPGLEVQCDDRRLVAIDTELRGVGGQQVVGVVPGAGGERECAATAKNLQHARPRIFLQVGSDAIAHGHLNRIPRGGG